MTDETKMIDAIAGPHQGRRLTVSAADFSRAIAEKWAVDPYAEKTEEPPAALTDEERMAALEAAQAWQDEQVALASGDKPKDEHKDMAPDDKPGGYTTRAPAPSTSTRRR